MLVLSIKLVKVALPWSSVSARQKKKSFRFIKHSYCSTYNVKSEVRSIGDIGGGLEVRLALLGGDIDLSAINRGAVEQIQTLHVDGLLEGNAKLGGQARRLDLGLSVYGDVESLVSGEPNVEGVEGVGVSNGNFLADVDELVLVAICRGEGDVEERSLAREILEIHDTVKGIDVGLDGAIGGYGGVDLQGDAVRLGVDDVDALDFQLGVVDLLLSDLGNSNEDAGGQRLARWIHIFSFQGESRQRISQSTTLTRGRPPGQLCISGRADMPTKSASNGPEILSSWAQHPRARPADQLGSRSGRPQRSRSLPCWTCFLISSSFLKATGGVIGLSESELFRLY